SIDVVELGIGDDDRVRDLEGAWRHADSLDDASRAATELGHPGEDGLLDGGGEVAAAGKDLGHEERVPVGDPHQLFGIDTGVAGELGDCVEAERRHGQQVGGGQGG